LEIYKTRWFDRWARKQSLDDSTLCNAIEEMNGGSFEADLGGHLLKKRVARSGAGKSGGYRTIIATKKQHKWIFVFAFEKSQRSDLSERQLLALKQLAAYLLSLSAAKTEESLSAAQLIEVICNEK
jgi:hypothetical protein